MNILLKVVRVGARIIIISGVFLLFSIMGYILLRERDQAQCYEKLSARFNVPANYHMLTKALLNHFEETLLPGSDIEDVILELEGIAPIRKIENDPFSDETHLLIELETCRFIENNWLLLLKQTPEGKYERVLHIIDD